MHGFVIPDGIGKFFDLPFWKDPAELEWRRLNTVDPDILDPLPFPARQPPFSNSSDPDRYKLPSRSVSLFGLRKVCPELFSGVPRYPRTTYVVADPGSLSCPPTDHLPTPHARM